MLNRSLARWLKKRNGSLWPLAVAASLVAFGLDGCELDSGSTGDGVSMREQRALEQLRPVRVELLRIDEFTGTYAGVGLGDSPAEVTKVFGPAPRVPGLDTGPLDEPVSRTGPSYSCDGIGGHSDFLRYRGVSFWINRGSVCNVMIRAEGISTRRGVAVGDSIDAVEEVYPELACRTTDLSEYADYRYCLGRLGPRRFVWFSGYEGEPIDNIELGIYPFCEACVRKPSFYR